MNLKNILKYGIVFILSIIVIISNEREKPYSSLKRILRLPVVLALQR